MNLVSFKLVTIICEPVILPQVLSLAKKAGATGFTITDVRGEGSGEKSSGEIPDAKSKIEIVSDPELAEIIMKKVAEHFFENYSVISYSADISVIRAEKFES